jgi:transcriptional regulator with XRE-family HTH domain
MAKSLLRLEARRLRSKGVSVKKIASYLNVSKSTASCWVRDIILSVEQMENLRMSAIKGAELGRLRSSLLQKQRRLNLITESQKLGIATISKLSERELLIAGLALYWGEGSKKCQEVEFCNSDPKMIKFLLLWLQKCFSIKLDEIKCCVGINEIHTKREKTVKEYWSKITGIPLEQFRKTSFKKVKNVKVYENFNNHFGTLSIIVTKPSRFYFKILGLIEGLYESSLNII